MSPDISAQNLSVFCFFGVILAVAGLVAAVRFRKSPLAGLGGLAIADVAYFAIGYGLGGAAGMTGAGLLLAFNGAARLLAFVSLLNLQRYANTHQRGELFGVAKACPLSGALFGLGMFAALGVSPFLTPDAKPLLLAAAMQSGHFWLSAALVLCNCVAAVLTLLVVHKLWMNGSCVFSSKAWRAEAGGALLAPVVLAVGLAAMGIFGHDLIAGVANFLGQNLDLLPDFSLNWHPAVLLVYVGAFAVFILGLFGPVGVLLRNLASAALPAAALWLLFSDASLAPLGRFFGVIVSGIGFIVALYSWGYMRRPSNNAYYFFLLLMFGSLTGIAVADNLGGFFVFWELMTLSSYVLVAWDDTAKAHAAAKKYFIMCSVAAAVMLPGLLIFQGMGGTLAIAALAPEASTFHYAAAALAALLVLVGCGVKAGLFPGHSWLPDAHPAAPSSVSAPLSGVLTKAGIFGIFQVFLVILGLGLLGQEGQSLYLDVPALGWVLGLFGLVTMLYGEIMALRQDDLKRLLAYSTMGQIGEICMTLGVLSWLAATGALMHMLNHAIMKDLLFLCSGALIMRAGTHRLADLAGLGKAMPFTAACMVIGLLSILGLPPFAGFMSKFMMLYALAEVSPLLAAVMLLASLAGVIYYSRIIKTLIFEPYNGAPVADAPWSMRAAMAILAGLCLVLGLFPQLSLTYMVLPVMNALGASGKLAVQALPALGANWPTHSILLFCGSIVPVLLRKKPRQAGAAAAVLLAIAAGLVMMDQAALDTLSFIFALAVTVIGCLNMVYSVGYMEHSHTQWRFYAFFLCMCAGLTGVATSSDLFSFFMFWEIMSSWSLYFVIVHEENPVALREGFKYFFFNVLGAAFLFLGVVLVINWSGGGEFAQIRGALPGFEFWQKALFLGLMAVGLVMKAAQLPFRIDVQMHPAAAPTPVSGYISSVLLKSSIFGLVKLFLVLGGGLALAGAAASGMPQIMQAVVWIGGITIVMAAVFAVFQHDIKLVLIYSTVSQLGYMVVGAALGTSLGVAGGLLHLVNHIFFKDLLFLVAGEIIVRTHRQSMNGLGGLGLRMPVTLALFCVGAVCVIGLPPSSGFTSKWIIYHALMEQGYVLVAVLSLVGSVLTLAYMTKMLHSVFLGQPTPGLEQVSEAPRVMLVPMGLLAFGCVVTSLFPGLALAPLNTVLSELGLPRLDVALWGLNSGAGAWNATLTALLMGSAWLISSILLKRLSRRPRVTDIHTCGIPPEELNTRTTPQDIYSTPASFVSRWRRSKTEKGA